MSNLNNVKNDTKMLSMNQLTNQLAFYESTNWEIFQLARQLNLRFSIPRCAILLEKNTEESEQEYSFSNALQMILSSMPGLNEDVFGSVNNEQFLIFKSVSPKEAEEIQSKEVFEFIENLRNLTFKLFGYSCRAYVGSVYTSLSRMHESFEEVRFLSSSPVVIAADTEDTVTIHHHLGEYLIDQLPVDFKKSILGDFDFSAGHPQKQFDTLRALITDNYNAAKVSTSMNLHRNTLSQRMNKLTEQTGIDPLHIQTDRTALHAYTIIKSMPVIWNACINIRPNNIIHLGFMHFSHLLEQKSEGRFQLQVNVVSSSGDYLPLFKAVCNHEIDCAAINTSILGSILENWPDILEYPFIFDSEEEAQYLMDHSILDGLQSCLNNTGSLVLRLWSMGWREFSSHEPIIAPNNLYGKIVRGMFSSDNAKTFFSNMGAELIHMYYSDLPGAMEEKIIDVQDNPYANIYDMGFQAYHRYVTQTKSFYDCNALICSDISWNSLPLSLQNILREALEETTHWMIRTAIRKNEDALRKLVREGMSILKIDPAAVDVWKTTIRKSYQHSSNPDLFNKVMKERGLYRAGKKL